MRKAFKIKIICERVPDSSYLLDVNCNKHATISVIDCSIANHIQLKELKMTKISKVVC